MKGFNNQFTRLFEAMEYLVDEKVGVIRYVEELPKEPGCPDLFYYYARGCNTIAFSSFQNFADAGGAALDRENAMAKAVGETIERYCAAIYDVKELPLCSYQAAPFLCVHPEEFALFSQEQYEGGKFPYIPFGKETLIRWNSAVEVSKGKIWHIPAAMVFIPYLYDSIAGELPITQPISTGLACHMSYARAATSGICEVVERDAFTIAWQACMQMPTLRIESLDEVNRDLVQRLERDGSRLTLVNITMDHGVPTILAVLRSWSQESPALVFGASASLDPLQAVRKSLEEIAHTRRLAQRLKKELSPVVPGPNYNGIRDQDSHLRFYCDQNNAPLAEFMVSSQKQTDLSEIESFATGDPENDLEILVKKISAINYKVLVTDITSPDIRELGFNVVRAVIPGFHPLFMGHGIRPLGGKRLWNVPQKLGYQGINWGKGDNPYPHPYP